MKQRNLAVDIAKGIAIIAIVWGHIHVLYPQCSLLNFDDLIYLWHVPVFFILGGFFIKEEQIVQPKYWFKKKFNSLYLKILYFYIPAVFLHNFFITIGWYSTSSIDPIIKEYSLFDFAKQTLFTICCAGREPILGAMWFVYVLFMALIGLSIISWIIKKLIVDKRKKEWSLFIVLLVMTILSGILSNKYDLTIRRFSNVFTAMLLINIGWIMNRKWKLNYDNGFLVIVCLMISFEVVCMLGGVSLNGNNYADILQLIIVAPAILYCIMYLGKKIEHTAIGKGLAYIGYDSFYIMALHFVGFKICSIIVGRFNLGGVQTDLTPNVGNNLPLFVIYLLFGVCFPLLFMYLFRKIKKFTKKL